MNSIKRALTPIEQMLAAVAIFALILSTLDGAFSSVARAQEVEEETVVEETVILDEETGEDDEEEQTMLLRTPSPKIKICHASDKGYDNGKKEVDESSITGSKGHDSHSDGGADGLGDIIPPFGDYPGKNWDAFHQAIWNNDCDEGGDVTVKKVVIGNQNVTKNSFKFYVGTEEVKSGEDESFAPGTYAVTETPKQGTPTNYTQTFSGDCTTNGQITVATGDDKTCIITNDYTDVCPNVQGQQLTIPAGYEKNTDGQCVLIDVCPNLDGAQETVPEGYEKDLKGQCVLIDVCPNIEGQQLTIPEGMVKNDAGECVRPVEKVATIVAHKIVCTDESDLPNWGTNGGPNVTSSTASEWVASHGSCSLVSGWNFEWVLNSKTSDPGDTLVGAAGGNWATFGPTSASGMASVILTESQLNGEKKIWMREVLKDGYIPFTHESAEPTNSNDVSAEFYCHTDVINYDNYEWIDGVQVDATYHCVAWNVAKPEICEDDRALNYGEEGKCEYEVPLCLTDANLLKNGSFETPVVGGDWGIFNPVANWVITLSDGLELWANGFYGGASEGSQNAELDGNAPTMISQTVTTVPGATYELRFDFSARPDADSAADNSVDTLVDGNLLMNVTADGSDITANTWSAHTKTFVADDSSTDISFKDVGTPNSYGTLIDNACLLKVKNPEPKSCLIYSDETTTVDGNPSVLTYVHPAWTTELTSGKWIWDAALVTEPRNGETLTFTKVFNVDNAPTGATLKVTSDNRYTVTLNGNPLSCDGTGATNFTSVDTCPAAVVSGVNTLVFTATNDPFNTDDPTVNPAGLAFELSIDGSTCSPVPEEHDPMCELTVVSDTTNTVAEKGDAFAKLVTWFHPAWTASIPGASWIWGDDPVADPVGETTQTFEKSFEWYGGVESAMLEIATDNSYEIDLNGDTDSDSEEHNHTLAGQDSYEVTSSIEEGNNDLSVEVKNWALSGGTAQTNPAGLLYKLTIKGSDPSCDDDEEPTYPVDGYKWNDEDGNGEWDEGEYGIAGWVIEITNGEDEFSTTTNADGYYRFDVPAGAWTVSEVRREGWTQTYPTTNEGTCPFYAGVYYARTVTLSNNDDVEDDDWYSYNECNFGNQQTEEEPELSCTLNASQNPVREGESFDLLWTTTGASYVTLNGEDVLLNGQVTDSINDDTTFTLIAYETDNTSDSASVECEVTVDTRSSGGGGGGRRKSSSGDSEPEPEILGESTSVIPLGAPNTGAGGAAPDSTIPAVAALLGILASLLVIRATRNEKLG